MKAAHLIKLILCACIFSLPTYLAATTPTATTSDTAQITATPAVSTAIQQASTATNTNLSATTTGNSQKALSEQTNNQASTEELFDLISADTALNQENAE